MLIGLSDLVKETKLSKIVINRTLFNIYHVNFPYKTSISAATIATANTVTRLS